MQVLYVAELLTVKNPSFSRTQLKCAAMVFDHCLIMILLPVHAVTASHLDVCEDHIPSNETGTNWKYYVVS